MTKSKKHFAIKSWLLLALLCAGLPALAGPAVGTVALLSGPLLAIRPDGTTRVLAVKSTVESGDTLASQKKGYAQIRFSDGSQLILQPNTALTIDRFSYAPDQPQADHIDLTLVRGGVRSTAGVLGKRSIDRVVLKTPLADIVMQSATVIVQYHQASAESLAARRAFLLASTAALDWSPLATRSDVPLVASIVPMKLAQVVPTAAPALPLGLYVQVIDGMINVSNKGGMQNFFAGEFGFTPSPTQPPVVVPTNPGLQFTPPPVFSSAAPTTTPSPGKSSNVDCLVR
jgi:hypothetical protein